MPQHEKGLRYAKLIHAGEGWPILPDNVVGAVYYHLAMKGDLHPEYHIYPHGDELYKDTCDAAEALLSQVEIFGASLEAPALAGPLGDIPVRLATLIADLAEYERSLLLRASSLGNHSADFSTDDASALQRTQKMRAALERAMRLAVG